MCRSLRPVFDGAQDEDVGIAGGVDGEDGLGTATGWLSLFVSGGSVSTLWWATALPSSLAGFHGRAVR
jgi:hypothetical protein